jgi:fumarylacetoacetase
MGAQDPLDIAEDDLFGPDNLPYGLFSTGEKGDEADGADGARTRDGARARVGVRYGDAVLDAGAAAERFGSPHAGLLQQPTLNALMTAGLPVWRSVRAEVRGWLTDPDRERRAAVAPLLHPLRDVRLHLPFEVADYVDFYASEHHASNVGRIFRPDGTPLTPNWKHLPIGYHGRAGTVVPSGTPVPRPRGQRKGPAEEAPSFGPSRRLDFEAEVGFVVGTPSGPGTPVPLSAFREHVFGVVLVNDWSARDIQAWEYVPLGPFLGKSFATSAACWVTPLDALDGARTPPPVRDTELLPYLDDGGEPEPGGLDLRLTVTLNGEVISEPPFSAMYWTAAQQLAHLTSGGARLRTGDLYASGTVSGPEPGQRGCLLELTWGGAEPLQLPDGERAFLKDGDEVAVSAWAPGPGGPHGPRIGLGEVTGRIVAAAEPPPSRV